MGKKEKSDKKSRTNQIEALRRKYEALLQEDKKRKERNDYILEKMGNMRTCTALAPTNHRQIIQVNASGLLPTSNNLVALGASASHETQLYQNYHQKVPGLSGSGTAVSVLRDIYNKYILIPKRQPDEQENPRQHYDSNINVNTTAPATMNTEINSDWKSKYEILNKIKQEEKESTDNYCPDFDKPVGRQNYTYANQQLVPEMPERDNSHTMKLNDENDGKKRSNNSNKQRDIVKDKQTSFKDLRSPAAAMAASGIDSDINSKEITPDSEEANPYPFTKIEGSEKIEHLDDEGINPAHISYPSENLGKPFGDVPDVTEDVQYPIDVINVEDFTPKPDVVVKDGVNVNPEEYGFNKDHFKPQLSHEEDEKDDAVTEKASHISSVEYDTNRKHFETVSPHEVYDDKLNTPTKTENIESNKQPENPEMALAPEGFSNVSEITMPNTNIAYSTHPTVPVPEHVEDLGNPSVEIGNTLGTEEPAMFYQEPTNEITYDSTAMADQTWDPTQNETTQQNEQYYYEGPHEMPESVHINEHEETSTPYDQNYEQQYNMANYEQQEYDQQYNPPQVGHGEHVEFESQQEYDQTGQAVYDESGQAVYDESGQAVYDQSEHGAYEQSEHVVYDQHAPMEQYNPEAEYVEQPFQQENYDPADQIEEQLNQEEGYVVLQNTQDEVVKMENQQEPVT